MILKRVPKIHLLFLLLVLFLTACSKDSSPYGEAKGGEGSAVAVPDMPEQGAVSDTPEPMVTESDAPTPDPQPLSGDYEGVDWHRWRGPGNNGISPETAWTHQWPGGRPRQLWKADVGTGYSSLSVSKGRVFTMGFEGGKDRVVCLEFETGREIWVFEYPAQLEPNMYEGGPNATPTVDGDHVYTFGKQGDLHCLDVASGRKVWSANVKEFGAKQPSWGFSGSPLVERDLVYVNAGTAGAAYDKKTGARVWANGSDGAGYGSPLTADFGGRPQVVLFTGSYLLGVEPETGKGLWSAPWETSHKVNAADPVLVGNAVFVSSGYGTGAGVFNMGSGKPAKLWTNDKLKNHFNPSVHLDGHIYGIDGNNGQNNALVCMDVRNGREKWRERRVGFGSLIASPKRLIVLTERGELMVLAANPDRVQPLARGQVLGGQCWTAPVLSQGRILCRNASGDVVCVDVRP